MDNLPNCRRVGDVVHHGVWVGHMMHYRSVVAYRCCMIRNCRGRIAVARRACVLAAVVGRARWWGVVPIVDMMPMMMMVLVLLMFALRVLQVLLSIRTHPGRDLPKDLLQSHLVPRKPLHVVERLHINQAIWRQRSQRVQGVEPSVGEVCCHCCRNLVRLEEVHDLVALPLQVRVHLPNRGEAMQVLWVMLAKEIHYEVDGVLGLLLLNLLSEPSKKLRHRGGSATATTTTTTSTTRPQLLQWWLIASRKPSSCI